MGSFFLPQRCNASLFFDWLKHIAISKADTLWTTKILYYVYGRFRPLLLKKIRPPCAPQCTMPQVGGAQRRSMVHNVALYHCSGAQHRSHKPTPTHGHLDFDVRENHLLNKQLSVLAENRLVFFAISYLIRRTIIFLMRKHHLCYEL